MAAIKKGFAMTNAQFRAERERKRLSGRIKKRILRRDNYRCCACRGRSDLTIHHAIPLADFFKKNKNTEQKIQEIRNDEILVTLCEMCHRKVHKEDVDTLKKYKKWEEEQRRQNDPIRELFEKSNF